MSRTYRYDDEGNLLRSYRTARFPNGTTKAWRTQMMNRPRRRANKRLCKLVMKGADSDALA